MIHNRILWVLVSGSLRRSTGELDRGEQVFQKRYVMGDGTKLVST